MAVAWPGQVVAMAAAWLGQMVDLLVELVALQGTVALVVLDLGRSAPPVVWAVEVVEAMGRCRMLALGRESTSRTST